MNRRTTAASAIAGALLALTPALAEAHPVGDTTPRSAASSGHEVALAYFIHAYRVAPLTDKRGIHNDLMTVFSDPEFAFRVPGHGVHLR